MWISDVPSDITLTWLTSNLQAGVWKSPGNTRKSLHPQSGIGIENVDACRSVCGSAIWRVHWPHSHGAVQCSGFLPDGHSETHDSKYDGFVRICAASPLSPMHPRACLLAVRRFRGIITASRNRLVTITWCLRRCLKIFFFCLLLIPATL